MERTLQLLSAVSTMEHFARIVNLSASLVVDVRKHVVWIALVLANVQAARKLCAKIVPVKKEWKSVLARDAGL